MTTWPDLARIVVPVDMSESSLDAVRAALRLADPAAIHVVHVVAPLTAVEPGIVFGGIDDQTRVERVRSSLGESLVEHGFGELPVEVRVGSPGVGICDFAAECDADLIVISSHGRTGLRRLLLGSVAEVVLRHAPCPVLVLRGDRPIFA